ncbi:hypothetical protein PENTCL1PPCAC_410, partial [Pristionchus entomophagus]
NGYDGSVTTTGKPGSSKGGLTKAIFEEVMGSNSFGITMIKGFDYSMKVSPSSGHDITCSSSTCFGKIFGITVPMKNADGPSDA